MVDAGEEVSQKALDTCAALFSANKISSEEHDKLKEMIFEEDGVLFSLVEASDSPADLQDAIVNYIKGDAPDEEEIAQMSSPMDGGLEMMKKRRQHNHAQKPHEDQDQGIAIGECDLGASPVMTKGLARKK